MPQMVTDLLECQAIGKEPCGTGMTQRVRSAVGSLDAKRKKPAAGNVVEAARRHRKSWPLQPYKYLLIRRLRANRIDIACQRFSNGREKRIDLGRAVRALTDEPACTVGLRDRGRLAPGYKADVNVIDLGRLRLHAPTVVRDLPGGGRRLRQEADGYTITLKSGQVTYLDGTHSGALPGGLVRGERGLVQGLSTY